MKIDIELNNPEKLALLLEFLNNLSFVQHAQVVESSLSATDKRPLQEFIGSTPALDVTAFDQYLEESRNEWERPIY